jgi:hypothetical protein
MSDKSTDELIQAWHRFFANKGDEEKREPDRWAVTKVRRLLHDSFLSDNEGIIDDPERAWEIILLLIDGAPSRKTLLAVVNPLRQLLDASFDDYIERVREESTRNAKLTYLLSHIFIHNAENREQLYSLGQRAAVLHFGAEDAQRQSEEVERLVEEWFRWEREPDLPATVDWVIDEMYLQLPECDPHKLWLIINRLLEKSKSNEELQNVGSLIGELLRQNYYEFIEAVRKEVGNNKRLAYALGNAYLHEEQKAEWSEFIELVFQHRTEDPFAK